MKRLLLLTLICVLPFLMGAERVTHIARDIKVGVPSDADICITFDLDPSADETLCWDQSDSSIAISDDLRVTGPNLTIGDNSSEDLILNFDDDAQTVWLRWDRSESRLAVSRNFYNANIIRSDQAFRSFQNATTDEVFQTTVMGDGANWRRFNIWADGRLIWGNGTADPSTLLTNLYRISTGDGIRTDGEFSVRGAEISLGDNTDQDLCIRFDIAQPEVDDPTICWNNSLGGFFELDGTPLPSGSGTDNTILRWDGTNKLQDSAMTASDDGEVYTQGGSNVVPFTVEGTSPQVSDLQQWKTNVTGGFAEEVPLRVDRLGRITAGAHAEDRGLAVIVSNDGDDNSSQTAFETTRRMNCAFGVALDTGSGNATRIQEWYTENAGVLSLRAFIDRDTGEIAAPLNNYGSAAYESKANTFEDENTFNSGIVSTDYVDVGTPVSTPGTPSANTLRIYGSTFNEVVSKDDLGNEYVLLQGVRQATPPDSSGLINFRVWLKPGGTDADTVYFLLKEQDAAPGTGAYAWVELASGEVLAEP